MSQRKSWTENAGGAVGGMGQFFVVVAILAFAVYMTWRSRGDSTQQKPAQSEAATGTKQPASSVAKAESEVEAAKPTAEPAAEQSPLYAPDHGRDPPDSGLPAVKPATKSPPTKKFFLKPPPVTAETSNRDELASEGAPLQFQVANATIKDQDGRTVYAGSIDLAPTVARIRAGKRLSFSHDGIVFENREKRLPPQPTGYYHEYVHPTPKVGGPGPQRVVLGKAGEVYYTADHYRTFRRWDDVKGWVPAR